LKHEQYKLKERIEQLRAMDGAAFLSLPASSFSSIPASPGADSDDDEEGLAGAHINGAASYNEGERRRKEMLEVAYTLEERYRVLLPPDRIRKTPGQGTLNAAVEPGHASQDKSNQYEPEPELEEEVLTETTHKDAETIKLKIKFPKRPNPVAHSAALAPNPVLSKKRRKSLHPPDKQVHVARRIKANYQPYRPEESSPLALQNTDRSPTPAAALANTSPQPEPHPVQTAEASPQQSSSLAKPIGMPPPHIPSLEAPPSLEPAASMSPRPAVREPQGKLFPSILSIEPVGSVSPPPAPSMEPEEASSLERVVASRPTAPMSNPDIVVLELGSSDETIVHDDGQRIPIFEEPLGTIYVTHPNKRVKVSARSQSTSSRNATREPSMPPIESISAPIRRSVSRPTTGHSTKQHVSYAGAAGKAERTGSVLMVAAIRSSGNSARKAKRHLSAFGSKLRNEVFEDTRDFVLPTWVCSAEEYEQRSRALTASAIDETESPTVVGPSQAPSQSLGEVS
jgi:hypothetical protein